jgi:hypothetical protein
VDDVVVYKTTDNVNNRVNFADIGEEFIAKAFPFAGAFNEARNVDKFNGSWNDAICLRDFSEWFKPCVWHLNNTYIWVDGTERVVSRFCLSGASERVEKRTLPHVW